MARSYALLILAVACVAAARSVPAVLRNVKAAADEKQFISVAGQLLPVTSGVPLYDYVEAQDKNYNWVDTGMRVDGPDYTGFMLNMTSQQWMDSSVTSRSVWWHQVLIIKPKKMRVVHPSPGTNAKDIAFLLVTGGNNQNPKSPTPQDRDVQLVAGPAVAAGTLGAVLWHVPNQAQVFADDPEQMRRSEDEIVAYTWRKYVDNPTRPDWVAYLPMVKSAVRAMDTVAAWAKKNLVRETAANGETNVRERVAADAAAEAAPAATVAALDVAKFVVTGMSKRGATTWLTGAYDSLLPVDRRRVAAIIPIVFDILNIEKNMQHMYQSLNGWTWQFHDYWVNNVTVIIGDPRLKQLAKVVDPFEYFDAELSGSARAAMGVGAGNGNGYRTLKKLVMTGTGDEFFMPDDNWYWWDHINNQQTSITDKVTPDFKPKGEPIVDTNYLYMVPNNDHSIATDLVNRGSVPFYVSVANKLDVELGQKPASGLLGQAQGRARAAAEPVIPHYDFAIDGTSGKLTLTSEMKPVHVYVSSMTSAPTRPVRRDYRMFKFITPTSPCESPYVKVNEQTCKNMVDWQSKEVDPRVSTTANSTLFTYEFLPPTPPAGQWTAFFFTVQYDIDISPKLTGDAAPAAAADPNRMFTTSSTTQVSIVPRTFPYQPCAGLEKCRGELV